LPADERFQRRRNELEEKVAERDRGLTAGEKWNSEGRKLSSAKADEKTSPK